MSSVLTHRLRRDNACGKKIQSGAWEGLAPCSPVPTAEPRSGPVSVWLEQSDILQEPLGTWGCLLARTKRCGCSCLVLKSQLGKSAGHGMLWVVLYTTGCSANARVEKGPAGRGSSGEVAAGASTQGKLLLEKRGRPLGN